MCVCLWQYYIVLIIVALEYSLKPGNVIPPALLFGGLLCFHANFYIIRSSSIKNAIDNFIGVTLNL